MCGTHESPSEMATKYVELLLDESGDLMLCVDRRLDNLDSQMASAKPIYNSARQNTWKQSDHSLGCAILLVMTGLSSSKR